MLDKDVSKRDDDFLFVVDILVAFMFVTSLWSNFEFELLFIFAKFVWTGTFDINVDASIGSIVEVII
jgi:hypothetical protein